MRQRALTASLGFMLGVAAPAAHALLQSCSVSALPVPFGAYTPSSALALSGTGTVTVTCTVTLIGLLETWTIALSSGSSGSFAARQMQSGGNALLYNLYTSAGHTQVWGDGSSGTATVSDTQLLVVGTSPPYPYIVYGVVNALQDKPVGVYSDTIIVTLSF